MKGKLVRNVVCPRCHGFKDTRKVPTEPGYSPQLKHYVCDNCKIGWYQTKAGGQVIGTIEDARRAYVGKERKA